MQQKTTLSQKKEEKAKGWIIDADYTTQNNESAIRLFFLTEKGIIEEITDTGFRPYFYAITEKDSLEKTKKKIEELSIGEEKEKVIRVEKQKKSNAENVLKIICKSTGQLTQLRETLHEITGIKEKREYDIQFAQRYLTDNRIKPYTHMEIEYKENEKLKKRGIGTAGSDKELVKATELEEKKIPVELIAIDIETIGREGHFADAKKDPIIMFSHSNHENGIITYKKEFGKIPFAIIVENEKELIESSRKKINESKAWILGTYNGDTFDLPFLKERAHQNQTEFRLKPTFSETETRKRGLYNATKTRGLQHVDAFQIVRFLSNIGAIELMKYDLESVYKAMFGEEKNKVNFKEIWEIWQSGKNIQELADYSREDAIATKKILEEYLQFYIELAKIIKENLFDATRTSTGMLVERILINKSFELNQLIPNKPTSEQIKERHEFTFKGAYVKEPISGLHENMAILDFRSFHPSILSAHNMSPETMNCDCCKETSEKIEETWYCRKKKGLIPIIIEELMEKRNTIKKEMKKHKEGTTEYKTLFAQQWSLKIILNSVYGYLGFPGARWYARPMISALYHLVRDYIYKTILEVEKNGFTVLYADSITKERFITLLNNKEQIEIKNIEKFYNEINKLPRKMHDKEFKPITGWKALSINPKTHKPEWKNILKIIRHKTSKKIFRVTQKYGQTTATEDHSIIINSDGELKEAKPIEMQKNNFMKVENFPETKMISEIDVYEILKAYYYDKLYKNKMKIAQPKKNKEYVWFGWMNRKTKIKTKRFIKIGSPEFAALCRILGAYIAEGSSTTIETCTKKSGASIASSNIKWLEELKKDYEKLFTGAKCRIIPSAKKIRNLEYKNSKGNQKIVYKDNTHKLQMMNEISAVFFKMFCGQKSHAKKLPNFIFNVPPKYKRILLNEYIKGDGSRTVNEKLGYSEDYKKKNFRLETKSLELCCGLDLLLSQLNIKHTIGYREPKQTYAIRTSSKYNSAHKTKIDKIEYSGYVYDLEVEGNNNFVDSCGQVLLHNTDSNFVQIPKNKTQKDLTELLKHINEKLPGIMEMELQGFYKRGIFVTKKEGGAAKKKYALIDYDNKLKIVGFEYVRRDWANIAKQTQKQVIEAILKEGNVQKAIDIVKSKIQELKNGKTPKSELIIMTQLTKKVSDYANTGPHVMAVQKAMQKGKKMPVGSIIEFIITKKGKTISEKARLAEEVKEGEYDAEYYIENQLLPAVIKIIRELGYTEEDLKQGGKQSALTKWG